MQIPFLAVYYIYFLAALVIRMLSVVYVALWMKQVRMFIKFISLFLQLPDPDYFYMNFYHWTFFNNYKAREYLGYTPLHNKAVYNFLMKSYFFLGRTASFSKLLPQVRSINNNQLLLGKYSTFSQQLIIHTSFEIIFCA